MACDLTTLQADACTSDIGRLTDQIKLLQVIAQILCSGTDTAVIGSQTPWLASIDGGGFDLTNVGDLAVTGSLTLAGGAQLLGTTAALTDGAGVLTATLTNSPVAGNATKWLAIQDGPTVRYIPAW